VRTLFAKILLWFWLALAVIVAALVLLESASRERGITFRVPRDDPFGFYAELAADAYRAGGRPEVARLLERIEQRTAAKVFGVDGSGAELLGRELPTVVRDEARATLARGAGRVLDAQGTFTVSFVLPGVEPPLALVVQRHAPPHRWPFVPRDLWLRMLVMVLVGFAGSYLLARYITAPVTRLRAATHRLAQGDLAARAHSAEHGRRDELEDLARDFDRMAERLEAVVSSQRRLLADISHELRSPLARMNVAIGILRQRGLDDADGMIARLETEAGRLNRLIGDLLTLSRLESGDRPLHPERTDLIALVEEVTEDARLEAVARGAQVELSAPETATVEGVPELLRSAIENVVRNAVRYTAPATAVEIAVTADGGAAEPAWAVRVRDHGPGVAEGERERIFEPFYRVEGTSGGAAGGTGLGLAIARRIARQHGGEIEARPAEGGGLTVTLRLPAAGRG
jgi:two-component system sensor histidine kinase CpxA